MTSIQVRGKCPECAQVHTTTAPKGRVTWRGTCPKRGCTGTIVARRFRTEDDPPAADPAGQDQAAAAGTGRKPRKVLKASGYQRQRPNRREPDPIVQQPDDDAGNDSVDAAGDGAGREPVRSDRPERPAGRRKRQQPVPADQHETGRTGPGHPYRHLFPGVWG